MLRIDRDDAPAVQHFDGRPSSTWPSSDVREVGWDLSVKLLRHALHQMGVSKLQLVGAEGEDDQTVIVVN